MVSVYDVHHSKLIEAVSKDLKKKVKEPEWAPFVKTGMHKERAPQQADWYYIRLAAVLRKFYIRGTIKSTVLRGMYGGKKNRGVKPSHFYRGSGAIIRRCLQDLEKLGFLEKTEFGRRITLAGRKYLDDFAFAVSGKKVKKEKKEKSPAKKKEEKEKKDSSQNKKAKTDKAKKSEKKTEKSKKEGASKKSSKSKSK